MPRTALRRLLAVALAALAALACTAGPPRPRGPVPVRILALNDFHGQLVAGKQLDGEPAGSAPVLASWLRAARAGREGHALIVSAGDLVGAAPLPSDLLRHEPTIAFLNQLAGDRCAYPPPDRRDDLAALENDPGCDVVAVTGNHEYDRGLPELLRLLRGGAAPADVPALERPWRGARFPFVAANVVRAGSGAPVFPAAVVRELGGVRVAVIGGVLAEVPSLEGPAAVAGLRFDDPVEAVNRTARALAARGVHAIVVLLHDGGQQPPYAGPTRADAPPPTDAVARLVARLDGEVDLVVSAHTHAFTNARLPNAAGRPVLVTQAYAAGVAFAQIDLSVDPGTDEVVEARAEIVGARADAGPGLTPDPAAAALTAAAVEQVKPIAARRVAEAAAPVGRGTMPPGAGETGEWPLGDLVTDAFRAATGADVALVQPGGLRADLPAGLVTWGDLHAALPFGDRLVTMTLTGRELQAALEQAWMDGAGPAWRPEPYLLQVSGLRLTWDGGRPPGERIRIEAVAGAPFDPDRRYLAVMQDALANGVDGFTALRVGREPTLGPLDTDVLSAYLAGRPQPYPPPAGGRLLRAR